MRKALVLSRDCLHEARRSVLDLRAAPLEGRSLAEAVRALLDEFQQRTGINTELHLLGGHHPLSNRLEVGIYRITQEALANVEQHAAAHRVSVELLVNSSTLQLSVRDNGRGFHTETTSADRYGLIGIRERVHLLGGKFELQSSPNQGTDLSVSIPLDEVT